MLEGLPLHREPLRTLFVLYKSLELLVLLPLWTLANLIPAWRAEPKYSFQIALVVKLCHWSVSLLIPTGLVFLLERDFHREKKASIDKELINSGDEALFLFVEPMNERDIVGELKHWVSRTGVQPLKVPAFWWSWRKDHSRFGAKALEEEKVILQFHGGGYVQGSSIPSEPVTPNLIRGLLDPTAPLSYTRILSIDYRLSHAAPQAAPSNPFPAALLDGLAAYIYLVRDLAFKPENIILTGESAGGNLALAIVRYLTVCGIEDLVAPPELGIGVVGGMLLNSPWCNLLPAPSVFQTGSSYMRNKYADIEGYRECDSGVYGFKGFRGNLTDWEVNSNPMISPGSPFIPDDQIQSIFKDYPRTMAVFGAREMLGDETVLTTQRIAEATKERALVVREGGERDLKTWVMVDKVPHVFHCFTTFPMVGAPRNITLEKERRWIAAL